MRRRELKSVVNSLGQWSLSRNFDCQGYWAIGKLYSLAENEDKNRVEINLLEREIIPQPKNEDLKGLITFIREFYFRLLEANGLPEVWVKNVKLVFLFNEKYQKKYHWWRMAIGKPMILKVQITTDLGKTYEYENGCNCLPHNPKKEQRRNGF